MKRSKPELLAPAGDLERLKIAILYGADAVYVGGPSLGLRANAINFTFEELKEGCDFAHSHNARVHVTVNIALHNKEIEQVKDYLIKLEEIAPIGIFGKTHGIKGEINLELNTDFDLENTQYIIVDIDGIFVPFFIEDYRYKTDTTALILFEDITT